MGKICSVDGGRVGIKGYIAPYRPPKACAVHGQDVFEAAVGQCADKHRQLTLVGGQFYLGGHTYSKCVIAYSFATAVHYSLRCDVFAKVCHHIGRSRCNVYCGQNLAHAVGISVLLLTVFQPHGCERQSCANNNHQHYNIYNGV